MKRILEIGGVVAGVVLIAFGAAAIVLANNGKNTIASELKFQQITGSPDMTPTAIKAEAKSAGLNWPPHRSRPAASPASRSRTAIRRGASAST